MRKFTNPVYAADGEGAGGGTEDKIIDMLDKAEGVTSGTQEADGDGQTTTGQPGDGQQDAKPDGQANPSASPRTTTQSVQTGNQQQQKPNTARAGDLVDPQTGAVIARAGAERRFYEAAQQARGQLSNAKAELDRMRVQIDAYKEANALPQQLGLEPAQVSLAMNLMASYIKDPVGTIKWMLTEAQAAGHNLSTILPGGGGLDPGAIKRMIDEAVSPLVARNRQDQVQQEAQQYGQQEAEKFFTGFPDAVPHEATIVAMCERAAEAGDDLTPREAYYQLREWTVRNGLDFSQPLQPQVAARNSKATTTPTQGRGAPVTTGRAGALPNARPRQNSAEGTADMSNADLVRQSMREAGLNI